MKCAPLFVASVLVLCCIRGVSALHEVTTKPYAVRFAISVNDTWDPNACVATAVSPFIKPNTPKNASVHIPIGQCDAGPLTYEVHPVPDRNGTFRVDLTFYSSVIEDASPPTCQIQWDGTYLPPTLADPSKTSVLPGCFTMDSREGYHVTYYWFYILEWKLM